MPASRLRVLKGLGASAASVESEDPRVVRFEELKRWLRSGAIVKHLGRYRDVTLVVEGLDRIWKPFSTLLLVRALGRGPCHVEDASGRRLRVDGAVILRAARQWLRDLVSVGRLRRAVEAAVQELEAPPDDRAPASEAKRDVPAYVYVSAAPWEGVVAGGSVAHVSGVANALVRHFGGLHFLSSVRFPGLVPEIRPVPLPFGSAFWDFAEARSFATNDFVIREVLDRLGGRRPRFVYHRLATRVFAGLAVARRLGSPLILEYNGSEIWVARHWGGKAMRNEALARRIDLANLRGASLVVVVSDVLRDEVVAAGVEPRRVLVNPNGVDAERYSPEVDGAPIRARYGLDGHVVIGFIGTFGLWHGAEVLAEAFGRMVKRRPEGSRSVRLLMIGDGTRMDEVRKALDRHRASDLAVLTGIVPQEMGALHLAACDVLVAPHVPNPDGTRFFGSPTKLFEYMAMGKGIVASRLEQLGEVLEHGRTAWLTRPGDVESLAEGLEALVDDVELRGRLGAAARTECLARYTWERHVDRILERLANL